MLANNYFFTEIFQPKILVSTEIRVYNVCVIDCYWCTTTLVAFLLCCTQSQTLSSYQCHPDRP